MKTIKLPVCEIEVTLTGDGGGSISSDLHEPATSKSAKLFNAAMDGIESLILSQACAGIDIESPQYLEALESAIQGVAENME